MPTVTPLPGTLGAQVSVLLVVELEEESTSRAVLHEVIDATADVITWAGLASATSAGRMEILCPDRATANAVRALVVAGALVEDDSADLSLALRATRAVVTPTPARPGPWLVDLEWREAEEGGA